MLVFVIIGNAVGFLPYHWFEIVLIENFEGIIVEVALNS